MIASVWMNHIEIIETDTQSELRDTFSARHPLHPINKISAMPDASHPREPYRSLDQVLTIESDGPVQTWRAAPKPSAAKMPRS